MLSPVLLGILAQFAPPPGATGEVQTQSNGTMCFVVKDEEGQLSQLCRSEFGDYPKPLAANEVSDPLGPQPAPVQVDDIRERPEPPSAGSRWGVASLAAGSVSMGTRVTRAPLSEAYTSPSVTGLAGIVGIGVRYGLRDRDPSHRMLMPALALVGGTTVQDAATFSPFLELRGELMSVSPGGPLQPNFVFYGTTGASTTPLGRGQSLSVQPHVGVGIGWNWLPRGGGGGSWVGGLGGFGGGGGYGLLALPVALAIVAMVFAGRVEVRYTARPVTGAGSDFVSVMFGVGS